MYRPLSNFKEPPPPHVVNTCRKPCICGNLALLSIFSNLGAVLGLTGFSSNEFFRYTVLVFLPLVLPPTYSLSLECSSYNASSTSNSTDIRASEEFRYLSWFLEVLLCLHDITKFISFTHDLLHSIPETAEIEAKETSLQEKK